MNLFSYSKKNPEILRLYCSEDSVTSGKLLPWKLRDDFKCDSMILVDEYTVIIKESGFYQTMVKLSAKKSFVEDVYPKNEYLVCFLAAVQKNNEATSLYYSSVENVLDNMMIGLNDVEYFEEGDEVSVVVGQCTIVNIDKMQNVFTIVKME